MSSKLPEPLAQPDERYLLEALEIEGALRALLYRFTRNLADVDELLQETYMRLLAAGSRPGPEVRSVRAFAIVVARNVARSWARHQQVVPFELVANLEDFDIADERERIEEQTDARQLLAKLVASLPPRCREVFVLRKVYGCSQKEIAAKLRISENTIEQHLLKATRRCAEALSAPPKRPGQHSLINRLRRRFDE